MNDVQKTLIKQVHDQVFLKPGQTFLVDEETVRFRAYGVNTDVSYDEAHDLYTVVQVRSKRGSHETVTTRTRNVFAEDLGGYFPAAIRKDANVRGMIASLRAG